MLMKSDVYANSPHRWMFQPQERMHGSEGMKKAEFKEHGAPHKPTRKHHIETFIEEIIVQKKHRDIAQSPHLWIFQNSKANES